MAWAEPESLDPFPSADVNASGCPTAEEEARLFLEQEAYYDSIDEQPFSFDATEDPFTDDAENF